MADTKTQQAAGNEPQAIQRNFPGERYYRVAKSYQIVEGSAKIQKLIIAQDALGHQKVNR